jgi:hypothetical protein
MPEMEKTLIKINADARGTDLCGRLQKQYIDTSQGWISLTQTPGIKIEGFSPGGCFSNGLRLFPQPV